MDIYINTNKETIDSTFEELWLLFEDWKIPKQQLLTTFIYFPITLLITSLFISNYPLFVIPFIAISFTWLMFLVAAFIIQMKYYKKLRTFKKLKLVIENSKPGKIKLFDNYIETGDQFNLIKIDLVNISVLLLHECLIVFRSSDNYYYIVKNAVEPFEFEILFSYFNKLQM